MNLSGRFIEAQPGRVFVTAWRAAQASKVAVICAPPAVEELNISRHQIAVQARLFCAAGLDTYVMDYYGTGDSEGQDFEASFENWQQSLAAVIDWVLEQGHQSIVLWGARTGSVVITALLSQQPRDEVSAILFWQPLESGSQWVSTLQRLKLLSAKQESSSQYSEIAGYQLSDALLQPLAAFQWQRYQTVFDQYSCDIFWVSASAEIPDRLKQTFSFAQSIDVIEGKPFWSIPESPVNDSLNSRGVMRLQELIAVEGADNG